MSVKYGRLLNDAAGTKSYTAIAVGRVMTCVLGMVVIREREIRNFKETPFYRVIGTFGDDMTFGAEWRAADGSHYFESPLLYKENGFKERESAQKLIAELISTEPDAARVYSIERGTSKKRAPLLFNLAELQAECSKRFKISPDETLKIAQDLYERKMTTYPRTDARVLSTAVAKEITKNISGLKKYEPVAAFAERILSEGKYKNIANTQYTDDSKISDHYAIIPTGQLTELSKLNDLHRKVFELIARRFLSIFYPPAEYATVKLVVEVSGVAGDHKERLFASAKDLKVKGYLEIAGVPKKKSLDVDAEDDVDDNNLITIAEKLKTGDVLHAANYEIKEGKTSPPKRYTSGSMVLAMENAGQLIEDEELREQIRGSGIGTSATRAEIIQKLVRVGYLNLNKKTQVLTPEGFGEMIYEVVNMTVPALLNPKMTASWEKGLDGITRGTVVMEEYRTKLEDFIRKETVSMIGTDLKDEIAVKIRPFSGKDGRGPGAKKSIGVKCPVCGGDMETTPFGFGCSNYKKDGTGCKFAIGTIAGKTLNQKQVVALLTDGRTETIRGFKSKSGKRFDACISIGKDDDGKVVTRFDFDHVEPKKLKDVKCPVCGGDIVKTGFGYGCANYNKDGENSCRFAIGRIAGVTLKDAQVKELLIRGKTDVISGFVAKTGMKFDAPLKLTEDGNIVFDFPERPKPVESSVPCPKCGKMLMKGQWQYECECGFKIFHTVAKVQLTDETMTELLTVGHTAEKVTGFTAKSGSLFDAYLKMEDERIVFDFDGPKGGNNNGTGNDQHTV
jgi:DNA topoisomerase-3